MTAAGDRILIAGAGLGGLTAALALIRRGFRVLVLEQAPALGEVGAGVQIGANGMCVLDHLGLWPALEPLAWQPEGKRIWAPNRWSVTAFPIACSTGPTCMRCWPMPSPRRSRTRSG